VAATQELDQTLYDRKVSEKRRSQFTLRMKAGRRTYDRFRSRHIQISTHVKNHLSDADWITNREIVRGLIHRIEIGPTKVAVVLRLSIDNSTRALDLIMVTLSRV
jgi:hypothetical protein